MGFFSAKCLIGLTYKKTGNAVSMILKRIAGTIKEKDTLSYLRC